MAKTVSAAEAAIEIMEMKTALVTFHLVGSTPLLMHRPAAKAQGELLLPGAKKNLAERATTLKHDPVREFRECVYLNRDQDTPTALHFPSNAFGKALADMALDTPGATKTQLQRLTSIASVDVFVWGIPQIFIKWVKLAGIARVPDIRTRAMLSQWCCSVTIRFSGSHFKEGQIANLFNGAGMFRGIGDWRPERGGQYGTWKIVQADNPDFKSLTKHAGRKAQIAALKHPVCADQDSEQIYEWFLEETRKREIEVPSKASWQQIDGAAADADVRVN